MRKLFLLCVWGFMPILIMGQSRVNSADSLALVALYQQNNGTNWVRQSGWLKTSAAKWEGVKVENARVVALFLNANNLTGELPPALPNLTSLTLLDLSGNELWGDVKNIPMQVVTLDIQRNQFSELPDLSTFRLLRNLNVTENNLTFEDFEAHQKDLSKLSIAQLTPQHPFGKFQSVNEVLGKSVTLSQSVSANTNYRFQWQKDGTNLKGATTSTLSLSAVTTSDAGLYTLRITHNQFPGLALISHPMMLQPLFVDLKLQKSVDQSAPNAGSPFVFTISVQNKGNLDATQIQVKDAWPQEVPLLESSPTSGTFDPASGIWHLPLLEKNGGTATLKLRTSALQSLQNCAEIAATAEPDPNSTPNNFLNGTAGMEDDADCATVQPIPQINLALQGTASTLEPIEGTTARITLKLTNQGPNTATNIQVKSLLPENLPVLAATATQGNFEATSGIWAVGDLQARSGAILMLDVRANHVGSASFRAEVLAASEPDTNSTPNNDDATEDDIAVLVFNVRADVPPQIMPMTDEKTPVKAGQPVTVHAKVWDELGVASVLLVYRAGGNAAVKSVEMTPDSDTPLTGLYHATIPASDVTARGLDFVIQATDVRQNKAETARAGLLVEVSDENTVFYSGDLPHGEGVENYRLISIPFNLKNNDIRTVLEPVFGTYATNKWRLFGQKTNGEDLVELTESALQFEAGKAYWLILRDEPAENPNLGTGTTTRTDRPFKRVLHSGWNMIGTPFNFRVPVSSLRTASGQPVDVQSYQGLSSWKTTTSLDPFEGYVIANNQPNQAVDTLYIYPTPLPSSLQKSRAAVPDWTLAISAQSGTHQATEAWVGMHTAASEGWDEWDRPAPPLFGEYIQVSFDHPDWQHPIEQYRADVRPVATHMTWTGTVRTAVAGATEVRFALPANRDENQGFWLTDDVTGLVQDLRTQPVFRFNAPRTASQRRFTLTVGSTPSQPEIPTLDALKSAFPNPFSQSTRIPLDLTARQTVSMQVFDLTGRKVAVLQSAATFEAGHHQIEWYGRDETGRMLPNGVYFVRVQLGEQTATQRIVLQR